MSTQATDNGLVISITHVIQISTISIPDHDNGIQTKTYSNSVKNISYS